MDVAALFDELCLRWAREADLMVQQRGGLDATLVLLPRDVARDEVAIRLEGLRGNLAERGAAIVAELRPEAARHEPAGLVLLTPDGTERAAVYVTLGAPALRRALGFRIVPGAVAAPAHLERADADPPVAAFDWLDALLAPAHPTSRDG